MRTQKMMWTALPNGLSELDRNVLKLSVFVSPQLATDTKEDLILKLFPDWLHWPQVARAFNVTFKSTTVTVTLPANIVSPAPDEKRWEQLFPDSTFVRSYQFNALDDRKIRSYRAGKLLNYLKDRYVAAAINYPTDFPPVADLKGTFSDLTKDEKHTQQTLDAIMAEQVISPTEPFDATKDFLRLQVFHKPPTAKRIMAKTPKFDFHEMLSSLNQYPAILRMLGLVFDLEITMDAAGLAPLPSEGMVQVLPVWLPETPNATDILPWTHYTRTNPINGYPDFRAMPKPGGPAEFAGGKLPLSDTQRFDVFQVDVDGLGLKTMDFAQHLTPLAQNRFAFPRASATPPSPQGPAAGLPTARTSGFAVARVHRASRLLDRFVMASTNNTKQAANDPADPIEFFAEDLVRGYRVDVWEDAAERWRSLHKRHGFYTFDAGGDTIDLEDEGWTGTSTTSSPDPNAPDDLYLPETLFEWHGWSLAVSRPDLAIGNGPTGAPIDNQGETADTGLKLSAIFKPVRKTLPRLRFGHRYRLQARTADLAGNGPGWKAFDTDFSQATPYITYGRFEPVPQPAIFRRFDYKTSETVEHLLFRSWTTPPLGTPDTEGTERHVAPPITSQLLAEQHGMFDDPSASDGWKADVYQKIIAKEGAFPPDTEQCPEPEWRVNYLPDPMARGAALQGLPGTTGVKLVPFGDPLGKTWPDYRAFRIVLKEGTDTPLWLPDARELIVYLPKAEVARVRLSSYLSVDDLQQMGLWQWVKEANPAAQLPALQQAAVEGRHWMLTPYREIQLIHAVQQPLIAPKWPEHISATRSLGDTFANFRFGMVLDGKSTQKLDVTAKWSEPTDPLAETGPKTVYGEAHAFTCQLKPTDHDYTAVGTHEFGDTKHRWVNYTATAMTRFPEFFRNPDGTKPKFTRDTDETTGPRLVDVPSSARPDLPKVLYILPIFEWEAPTSTTPGNVTHLRKGNGLRVYLDRSWFSSGDDELLGVVLNVGPSTRVPAWTPDQTRDMVNRFQSQWARDPAVASLPAAPALALANFTLTTASATNLSLAEVPDVVATVAGHAVDYDPKRNLWYCDVHIAPTAGFDPYWPFVRLSLVRYQPHSIMDAHLSRTVLADFVQLAADRKVSIVPAANNPSQLTVTVSGTIAAVQGAGSPPRKVEVTVERHGTVQGELGWVPTAGKPVSLSPLLGLFPIFTGQVTLPGAGAGDRFRLMIKEYERLVTDPADRSLDSGTTESVWRLVFADVVNL